MADEDRPRLPPVRRPGYRDPTEGVDWGQERFHQAFVRNHLYRGPGLPFGVLVMIFVLVLFGAVQGLLALAEWLAQ